MTWQTFLISVGLALYAATTPYILLPTGLHQMFNQDSGIQIELPGHPDQEHTTQTEQSVGFQNRALVAVGPSFSSIQRLRTELTVYDSRMRQRAEPHCTTHVVCEVEKSGAVGNEAQAIQSNAVADPGHAVLSHSKAQIAAFVLRAH
eukprot:1141812-Pelagomonas_calceolata.AAC.1